jgi:hypothetical protein
VCVETTLSGRAVLQRSPGFCNQDTPENAAGMLILDLNRGSGGEEGPVLRFNDVRFGRKRLRKDTC